MTVSVVERIKEIGLRNALGATKSDIMIQFIFESIFISIIGGSIGTVRGMSNSKHVVIRVKKLS